MSSSQSQIYYSDKYEDGEYEYRWVVIFEKIRKQTKFWRFQELILLL